jgi:hypothetical protein
MYIAHCSSDLSFLFFFIIILHYIAIIIITKRFALSGAGPSMLTVAWFFPDPIRFLLRRRWFERLCIDYTCIKRHVMPSYFLEITAFVRILQQWACSKSLKKEHVNWLLSYKNLGAIIEFEYYCFSFLTWWMANAFRERKRVEFCFIKVE